MNLENMITEEPFICNKSASEDLNDIKRNSEIKHRPCNYCLLVRHT